MDGVRTVLISFLSPMNPLPNLVRGDRRIDAMRSPGGQLYVLFLPADAAALTPWIRVRENFLRIGKGL